MPAHPSREVGARAASHIGLVVDVHSHFFPREFLRAVRDHGPPYHASVERQGAVDVLTMPGHPPVPLDPQFVDVEARLERLETMGITVQVLSLSPPMVYWAPPRVGADLARAFNDGIAEISRSYPERFVGAATLPLQDVRAAVAEAERAVRDLGMRGLYVGTSVNGQYLDEPQFRPIWELATALDVPVFTHPQTHVGADVLGRFHLFNSIGFPVETATMAARLIYSGLFEAHPNLRVVLAHGGGVFPLLLGRLDHAHRQRAECRRTIPRPPSAYVRHFYYDTVTHGDQVLRFLVETVGASRVVLGSDAPYDMAEADPVGRVRRLGGDDAVTEAILGATAGHLLGMRAHGGVRRT
ncbi:MAG: amidohydrolase family protein [Armatimonadota bacterium]|nr:amidohydrolase family protein [Armatimonadota bacterium]